MSNKLLFVLISVIYIILIASGLTLVYSVGNPEPARQVLTAKDNKISIAHTEIFGKLQRPQVIFDHKKHEEAYKQEGCVTCHPINENKELVFTFPKKIEGEGATAVMKAFHDECIECHKKEKKGPVTCNNCHIKDLANVEVDIPRAAFDFADHNKHVKIMSKFGRDDCGQCHHTFDLQEQKLIKRHGSEESCASCHDLDRKKGPQLAAITKVAAEKGLSTRRVSHQGCLNCHVEYQQKYRQMSKEDVHGIHQEKMGCNDCHVSGFDQAVSCSECHVPTECSKCHTGKYRTVSELKNTPRPDRGQNDIAFIDIENSSMKGVPFNHRAHQANTGSCRLCHHETLQSCKECHSLTGKPEGNGINIATAYHHVLSEQSCAGCHNKITSEKECAGCHYYISGMDVETMNPKKNTCAVCHSGRKDQSSMPKPLSTPAVREEIEINVLARDYKAAKFPHRDIIDNLVRISNSSRLATYFHRDIQTLCRGCHHQSNSAAEMRTPQCRNCHMVADDRMNLNRTKLLSAYHRQCLGCHEKMEMTQARKCLECHEASAGGAAEIVQFRNESVVKQNTTTMLNVWRPK